MSVTHLPEWRLDRTIRVFVSSTFRDMSAERSCLMETTFPRIQKYCSEKNVYFIPLDLRWGITEEQSQSGKVAEVCLQSIKRSKPFFIGLLGKRYGWTPDKIELNNNPGMKFDFPFVEPDFQQGLSITEVEMQYGVLRESEPMNAAFWLRSEEMPTPNEFQEQPGTEAYEKLEKLKSEIQSQDKYPVGQYVSLEDLDEQVYHRVIQLVDELFPGEGLTEFENLQLQQNAFARYRTRLYVGRDSDFDRLNIFADGSSQNLVITGLAGNGKSALLANWMRSRCDLSFASCFVGASPRSDYPEEILKFLIGQLNPDSEIMQPKEENKLLTGNISKSLDELRNEFGNALVDWYRKNPGRKLVLLIDGMNQIPSTGNYKLLNWIPLLPDNVKLICSTWSDDPTMEVFKRRHFESMDVAPLTVDQRKEIIVQFLQDRERSLLPGQIDRIASCGITSSPMVLRTLLDELCVFGSHEELDARINWYLSADSEIAFFAQVLERLEQNFGEKPVSSFLTVLAASRYGLSNEELLAIVPDCTLFDWQQVAYALDSHFIVRAGLNDFAHGLIREAAMERYKNGLESARREMINYFQKSGNLTRYCEEVPYQYNVLNDLPGLNQALLDFDVLNRMFPNPDFTAYWYRLFKAEYKLEQYFELDVSSKSEEEQATSYFTLAYFASTINQFSIDEQGNIKALGIYRKLATASPDAYLPYVAATLHNLAILHSDMNRYAEAEGEYTEALEIRRKLAAACPDTYLPRVAATLQNLAILHSDMNRYAEAEGEYTEALEIYRKLAAACPDTYLPYVADTLYNLANVHPQTKIYTEAKGEYTEALEIYRKLAAASPDAYLPRVANTLVILAILHSATNRYAEAEGEYTESLEISRKLAATNPDMYLPGVAQILHNLGDLHSQTKRYTEAEGEYTEALEIRRKLAAVSPDAYLPGVAQILHNLGDLHSQTKRYTEAEGEYTEALEIRRKLAAVSPDAYLPRVAETLYNLGYLHYQTKRYTEAEGEYTEALEIHRKLATTSPDAYLSLVADTLYNLGVLHKATNRYAEAETEYTESLEIRRKLAATNPEAYLPDVADTLYKLGVLHENTKRCAEAEAENTKALEIRRKLAA
ncbi:MAG: tetratricopeptide repeat protein, partial [Thermoguttaceae bacterium]|nr:tetratricopeptide repeat protein [Thermoguttaceae bacterium]